MARLHTGETELLDARRSKVKKNDAESFHTGVPAVSDTDCLGLASKGELI